MAVERGEIKRLMVFMPPRHSKSLTTTIHFPAWYLGRNPDKRVITASYGASLAEGFSRQTRTLLQEYGEEVFGIRISRVASSVDNWAIQGHYGGLVAAGVGGSLTGKGADLLIIDDPHKDREEANSQTIRDRVWEWYSSTAYTRLEPDGAVIVIQTRWHEEDLSGLLLKAMESDGDQWEIINFPAIAEDDNDILDRDAGEALWPERFDIERLNAIQRSIGSKEFVSLYQQRPQSLEGGAFKAQWFKWYTKSEISYNDDDDSFYFRGHRLNIFMGIDLAMTEKTSSDDFAIVTIGVTDTLDILALDVLHGQFDPGEQGDIVSKQYEMWLPERIAVEDNGGQKYFVSQLKRWHQTHSGFPRMPIKGVTNTGDKYSRIARNVPFVENGGLYLRQATDNEEGWTDMDRLPNVRIHLKMRKLYEQLVTFAPKMAHEDVADAWDIAVNVAARNGRFQDDWSQQAALRDPMAWMPGGAE